MNRGELDLEFRMAWRSARLPPEPAQGTVRPYNSMEVMVPSPCLDPGDDLTVAWNDRYRSNYLIHVVSPPPGGGCANRPPNHAYIDGFYGQASRADAVAVSLTSGAAAFGSYCANPDDQAYWWKLPGPHAAGDMFRLQVEFNRGPSAEDVDFQVVHFKSASTGYVIIAACSAPSGVSEDCVGSPSDAISDIYVRTVTGITSATEGFALTLTKY